MLLLNQLKPNTYFDSVTLMAISTKVNQLEGVIQAQIAMGTPMNKAVLKEAHLFDSQLEKAGPSDLMIALSLEKGASEQKILSEVEKLLIRKPFDDAQAENDIFHSINSVNEKHPETNLAIISVNGLYAAREAEKALNLNKNVMLFSDNVSIEQELKLKQLAHQKGLLMMGPDCGTAIINGVGLGFANKVRGGNIGIVAASGTGAQEISVRIHEFGGGISQLIGTGGRDLSEDIGGIMMLDGLQMLAEDPNTDIIIVVSKPPAPTIARKILSTCEHINKPIFIWFLGYKEETKAAPHIHIYSHSKPAAMAAVIASGIPEESIDKHALNLPLIKEVQKKLNPQQRYIRGLFCGGTLCDEALFSALEKYPNVYSNIQTNPAYKLQASDKSIEHTFIDFGDDSFTNGKAHPMIDPSYRIERILQEGRDPEVGVLLLDFVLGFGANPDPIAETLPALLQVKREAQQSGRHLEILAYVLGTELDQPSVQNQVAQLEAAGITIASSSTNAGLLAREFVAKGE
ncbi:acyl-CoA synthetase FdrA [Avibacterium paragallinarum]|uniref:Acyl-CoA synthetase FdrA n=4 Tax=Pasteurellaceae TaxID=712 RepID=A0A8B3TI82_AVIPA|nr:MULTISPECIES: acyl-CoA synthetase FdrA [Pasteurellaceae]MDK9431458.1 acyl-CoA synthetase FdrA [Gallibacterium anatis]RZN58521.1 acyl-CoA synthetase FdrA [Avibacterium paragallinarum]RZN60507.1 acyl-CoA synthetase FdrA [Avibacterium paragallinarum]UXN36835.1 acyl-CoA synthetase FdrA [Avibacterium paragallinarum]WIM79330.1 acyl-CoA synthetase FdrA [Gallibacterium anatis]